MRILATAEARSLIQAQGGLLFVWVAGATRAVRVLRTSTEPPPDGLRWRRVETRGFRDPLGDAGIRGTSRSRSLPVGAGGQALEDPLPRALPGPGPPYRSDPSDDRRLPCRGPVRHDHPCE